jgi:hypothetical protein
MRDFLILFAHLIVTVAQLARPGGLRSVVAESVLVRHQLLVLNRGRKRAPKLRTADRIIAGLCTLFMRRARLLRSAIVLKPSTLLHFHSVLRKRKYRSSRQRTGVSDQRHVRFSFAEFADEVRSGTSEIVFLLHYREPIRFRCLSVPKVAAFRDNRYLGLYPC